MEVSWGPERPCSASVSPLISWGGPWLCRQPTLEELGRIVTREEED